MQRQVALVLTVQTPLEISHLQILDKVVDMPVLAQQEVHDHKNSGVNSRPNFDTADHVGANRGPLLQFVDNFVGIVVVAKRQIFVVRATQKTLLIPQVHYIDKVVDVIVVLVVLVP